MTLITREKNYNPRGCPGTAWTWLYTVHAPDPSGLCDKMRGRGLGWARGQANMAIKDGRSTAPVTEEWKERAA